MPIITKCIGVLIKAIKQYEFYKTNGQEHIFDIAYEYAGMGHIKMNTKAI